MFAQAVVLLALLSVHDFAQAAKCPTITTQKDFDVTKVSLDHRERREFHRYV